MTTDRVGHRRKKRRHIPRVMDVTATLRRAAEKPEEVDGKKVEFIINEGEGERFLELLADLGDRGVSLSELMVERIEDDGDDKPEVQPGRAAGHHWRPQY